MSWLTDTLTSSLGRKLIVALTGLFLILFLVIHLIGNLQLLYNDGGESFNAYADFMSQNTLIQTISKLNFVFILLHIFTSFLLIRKNNKARKVGYNVPVKSETSTWMSRNMGVLGTIILAFLIIHLQGFYFRMHFDADIPTAMVNGEQVNDLYTVASVMYSQWYWVAIYVFSMLAIAFHLSHGFQSAFQTLGLNHVKYSPAIKAVGLVFAIIVPLLFAVIPVVMFLNQ